MAYWPEEAWGNGLGAKRGLGDLVVGPAMRMERMKLGPLLRCAITCPGGAVIAFLLSRSYLCPHCRWLVLSRYIQPSQRPQQYSSYLCPHCHRMRRTGR